MSLSLIFFNDFCDSGAMLAQLDTKQVSFWHNYNQSLSESLCMILKTVQMWWLFICENLIIFSFFFQVSFMIQMRQWHQAGWMFTWHRDKLYSSHFHLTQWGQEKNGCHFADNIFKVIFHLKIVEFWLKFHWNIFLRAQLTIIQHWVR